MEFHSKLLKEFLKKLSHEILKKLPEKFLNKFLERSRSFYHGRPVVFVSWYRGISAEIFYGIVGNVLEKILRNS